ncbi:hypothetical protein COBT_000126 [Conglomerata obtusa]
MLIIDNVCNDVYDFDLVYNVISKSSSLKNYSYEDKMIIINLKQNDAKKREDYKAYFYKNTFKLNTKICFFEKLTMELVDLNLLDVFRIVEYSSSVISMGKLIDFKNESKIVSKTEILKYRNNFKTKKNIFINNHIDTSILSPNDEVNTAFFTETEVSSVISWSEVKIINLKTHTEDFFLHLKSIMKKEMNYLRHVTV